jgi:hypothetical protein
MDFVGGVYSPELEVIAHSLAERSKRLLPDFRHKKQGRSNVKAVTFAEDLIATSPRCSFFFQNGYVISISGKSGGGGNPANPGADHERSWFLHKFS